MVPFTGDVAGKAGIVYRSCFNAALFLEKIEVPLTQVASFRA
jgi:hypothetical protein